ncbi:nucleoside-diphosphate sugar epimerase [Bacillus manliponensis]|uniref:nucleoside-diphosphate sugar epimerase n=1 Tax=Bacillus manliponensis TaxID=574376 RepID=UPI003516890D
MYYIQPNLIRKLVEPTIVFLVLALVSVFSNILTPLYEYFILLFILLLFASQYGIYIALFTFIESVIYIFFVGIYKSDDVLLYFFSLEHWLGAMFLLLVSLYAGGMSTSRKERYEDISMVNTELQNENTHLKEVVAQLNETRITLRSRVLESDNHLAKMFHMFKALNHTHPEIVLDEGMNILKTYFGAKKIAIYYVDENKQSLRIKLRSELGKQTLPQSIFVNTTSRVIKDALTYDRPFFRTKDDFDDAPLLVGPVSFQEQIRYLVVLDEIEFSKVTSDQFELFVWYLRWMSDRLQNASSIWLATKEDRTLPNTNIYHASEFEHLLTIEKKRFETLAYPYAYFEVHLPNPSLQKLNTILKKHLREIDILGYDSTTQKLMVLLPGTEERFLPQVKERVIHAMTSEMLVKQ